MLWAAAIVESQRHLAFLIRYVIRNRQDFSPIGSAMRKVLSIVAVLHS